MKTKPQAGVVKNKQGKKAKGADEAGKKNKPEIRRRAEIPTALEELKVEDVRLNEDQYRRLIEHAPYGVVIHQQDRVIYLNPAGMSAIGAGAPGMYLASRSWILSTRIRVPPL